MPYEDYPQAVMALDNIPARLLPMEQLEVTKKRLEQDLVDVNEAIEALTDNPGILDVLNKLRKVGV